MIKGKKNKRQRKGQRLIELADNGSGDLTETVQYSLIVIIIVILFCTVITSNFTVTVTVRMVGSRVENESQERKVDGRFGMEA